MLRIVAGASEVRKPGDRRLDVKTATEKALCLITQTLLMPILLHTLSALMFGDFRFASFFKGTHKSDLECTMFRLRLSIQARHTLVFNLLLHFCAKPGAATPTLGRVTLSFKEQNQYADDAKQRGDQPTLVLFQRAELDSSHSCEGY